MKKASKRMSIFKLVIDASANFRGNQEGLQSECHGLGSALLQGRARVPRPIHHMLTFFSRLIITSVSL